ncbi:MAG TPA: ribosome small subunit-dependent GTPase A [Gemmatimonadaceae bacterium]|nr:ribosome small subunit-dependent GTPase A [Gemmatimonadaceae bacterium]
MSAGEGVVLRGTGGVWVVRGDDGVEREAALRGRLKQEKTLKLAVGDRVTVEPGESGGWAIAEIHPRRSSLVRRAPGTRVGERVIAANVDQVVVVFAMVKPEPHVRMLDRFLTIAESNDLAARVVVNKVDLASEDAARAKFAAYERAGYPMHFTSTKERRGLDALRAAFDGQTSAVTGPSGVGKSSLLNALYPGLSLRVGEISESVNKGRHTTVGAYMHPLPDGGYVVDTPGLREVGMWGIPAADVDRCFPELRVLRDECRFADCTHRAEPDCAVRAAVHAGTVDRDRYESYLKLREELEDAEGAW